MAYRLKRGDDDVQEALRRIAIEQIDKALAELDEGGVKGDRLDLDETVHQVRKRCKKLRGLVRLVRPAFPAYAFENAAFRDAARGLSGLRDARTLIDSYDDLMEVYAEQVDRNAFASIRRRLTLEKRETLEEGEAEERLAHFRELMTAARGRAAHWKLKKKGFKAFGPGLEKSYARAAKATEKARPRPGRPAKAKKLHEWRKRVKYHWYHARLLEPLAPAMLGPQAKAADALGDLLGAHHDLAVIQRALLDSPGDYGDAKDVQAFLGLIERRQAALEAEAFRLGEQLLAEKPAALRKRCKAYWKAWEKRDRRKKPPKPLRLVA